MTYSAIGLGVLVLFLTVPTSKNAAGQEKSRDAQDAASWTRIVVTAAPGETAEEEVNGCKGDEFTPIRLRVSGHSGSLGFFKCDNDVAKCVVEEDNKCDDDVYPKLSSNKGTCGAAATTTAPAIAICEYEP